MYGIDSRKITLTCYLGHKSFFFMSATIATLKVFLKRLHNLTARNKSLMLLTLPKEQFLDLHELDFIDGTSSFGIIEQLIARKEQIPLCEVMDPRMEKANELSKVLKKIAKTAAFINEERGSQDLYVGYPMVQGKFVDGTMIKGPLLFFSVQLFSQLDKKSKTEKWFLTPQDQPPAFNQSFLLAYSYFNQSPLQEEILEQTFEHFDNDSLVFRTQLYEYLKESPLAINFNKNLFINQLEYFEKQSKADLDLNEGFGQLRLLPQAVLGIFPQSGSYLVPDYETLIDAMTEKQELADNKPRDFSEDEKTYSKALLPTEKGWDEAMLGKSNTKPLDFLFLQAPDYQKNKLKEEHFLTPLAIDASQEMALKMVKNGASLVVQGPPGTGKSQLICNLIADFTAQGKRVLVVSQKRAALDTVFERLALAKMSHFVALVHDFKNDRKTLFAQIFEQIEKLDDYKKVNQSLDAIFLEREFVQNSRNIERIQTILEDFKTALFDNTFCGFSPKELYLSSNPTVLFLKLENQYKYFKINALNQFESPFKQYGAYTKKIKKDFAAWQNRRDFKQFSFGDIPQFEQTIADIVAFKTRLGQQTKVIFDTEISWQEILQIHGQGLLFVEINNGLSNPKQWQIFQELMASKKKLQIQKFNKLIAQALGFYEKGIEKTLSISELGYYKNKIKENINKRATLVGNVFWKLFGNNKDIIKDLCQKNNLGDSVQDLVELLKKIEAKQALATIWQEIKALLLGTITENLATEIPDIVLINTLAQDYNQAYRAFECGQKIVATTDLKSIFDNKGTNLKTLLVLFDETSTKQSKWQKYLTDFQINALMNGVNPLDFSLQKAFDFLHDADVLMASFNVQESEMIHLFGDDWQNLNNSVRLAWLQALEEQNPILRSVSSLKMSQLEEELQEAIQKKEALSQEILLLYLREQCYKDVELNRLQNPITYRELKHQVSKKRKVWPLRKLMATCASEVFRLMPCWMASPEAVSAIFPLLPNNERLFDLIIFDEASQCFAEQGIPAMLRGRQVVVAGDSQQLQPNDLYRIRFEDETTEENPDMATESLLDLATQYLPQIQLKGHYRSKSLALISFSNQHFYKNSLQLLPHFQDINTPKPPIKYIKVDGLWQHNQNKTEALKVWELVIEIKAEFPEKSIGIISFNQQQQRLIESLAPVDVSPMTFIKNIENVQGDERDIIVFSVGYAPDSKGKMNMQFGSLNQQGGQNRLNVAVTRAKEQIYLITSILPEQLQVENTLNQGPKLLKSYLAFALKISQAINITTMNKSDFEPTFTGRKLVDYLSQKGQFQLPFADLTVMQNDKYKSLILTDDDLYYESLSAKEAHAYLPIHLTKKQWPFERFWSRNYWLDH